MNHHIFHSAYCSEIVKTEILFMDLPSWVKEDVFLHVVGTLLDVVQTLFLFGSYLRVLVVALNEKFIMYTSIYLTSETMVLWYEADVGWLPENGMSFFLKVWTNLFVTCLKMWKSESVCLAHSQTGKITAGMFWQPFWLFSSRTCCPHSTGTTWSNWASISRCCLA